METKQKLIKITTTNIYFIFFFILINLIYFSNSSTFFISSFNEQYDCVDLICNNKINNDFINFNDDDDLQQHKMLIDINTGKILDKCSKCSDCTNSGYSNCMQSRQFDGQKHQFITIEGTCECSHSGPFISNNGIINKNISSIEGNIENTKKCKVLDVSNGGSRSRIINEPKLDENEAFFRLCYSSALRKLPLLQANNEQVDDQPIPTVLVTVEQFWLDKYWQTLNPKDLNLYYVFPVAKKEHCEKGITSIPDAQDLIWINSGKVPTSGMIWLCITRLKLQMGDEQEDGGVEGDDNYDYQSNMDPKLPQEIQFDRNVFAGAERARFYYEVVVVRDNQLKAGAGKPKFEHRETLVRSDILDFELHPEIYGTGMEERNDSIINKSENIEEQNKKIINEKEKGKYDIRLPIVRPILRTKGGKEKSVENSRVNTMREISQKPIFTREENIEEIEATTLMPIPLPKIEKDSKQKHQFSQKHTSSFTPQTQMSSTLNIFNTDSKLTNESDSKTTQKEEESNKKVKEKDEDWLLFRNVLIVFIVLLFVIVVLGFCYKCSFLCFSGRRKSRENTNGQQINGNVKKRVQNGKEYKEANNNYT